MTQEQKQKIEQAAARISRYEGSRIDLARGIQEVLQNPAEFGLIQADKSARNENFLKLISTGHYNEYADKVAKQGLRCGEPLTEYEEKELYGYLKSLSTPDPIEAQLKKYRQALERILSEHDKRVSQVYNTVYLARDLAEIAKEALKQEGE